MSKYVIYKNKRTRHHPSIQIDVLEDGTWENIEITDSPTSQGSYEEFDVNPNPNSNKKSYFRKYLRRDKLRHRGEELKKYRLVLSDEIKIDVYVSIIKEKMVESLIMKLYPKKGTHHLRILKQSAIKKARKKPVDHRPKL